MNAKRLLSICVLITFSLTLIVSCGIDDAIEIYNKRKEYENAGLMYEIKDSRFEYNGSTYSLIDKSYRPYIAFFDNNWKNHLGEVVGHYDAAIGIGDISKTCEADFGDNVLKMSDSYGVDYATKDGFSFPTLDLLRLDNLYISSRNVSFQSFNNKAEMENSYIPVKSFTDEDNAYFSDIVDFESYMKYDPKASGYTQYFVFCTLKDYETIYLGYDLRIHLHEDEFYVWPIDFSYKYKVKPEYQELFKEAILNYESNNT